MKKLSILLFVTLLLATDYGSFAQSKNDTLILRNIEWGKTGKAGFKELQIPSSGSLLQGFIYLANGAGKHPLLVLLHGFPGNERNLDLAQVARSRGWNVVYFDYRGSWASQGKFSFKHCVDDAVNVVAYCKANAGALDIDTANICLFGHSMGAFVCQKALAMIPSVKKGFALSTWDIAGTVKSNNGDMQKIEKAQGTYFVLNSTVPEMFQPVLDDPNYFDLKKNAQKLINKQLVMLDEHSQNKAIADAVRSANKAGFDYQVWNTDHGFNNYRVSLIKKALAFFK
jgi:pimeloyl-ACP methyl ester carboxylesterase